MNKSFTYTVWIRWMSHWRWNNGPNGLHWPVRPIRPIYSFPCLVSICVNFM